MMTCFVNVIAGKLKKLCVKQYKHHRLL